MHVINSLLRKKGRIDDDLKGNWCWIYLANS